jgi:diaminopropionate ammonia-lyase
MTLYVTGRPASDLGFDSATAAKVGQFHAKLPGFAPSRLVSAAGVAAELGLRRVWVKDESERAGMPSFKILGASWASYKALEKHLGGFDPWDTIADLSRQLIPHRPLSLAAATDGNHGRAVARMARLLDLGARIFVPTGTSASRIAAIESEGASCEVVPGGYDDAVERSAQEASESCLVVSDTSWPGYEQIPAWVIDGYATIFEEVDSQLASQGEGRPDAVFVQIGVGALGAAAARHYRRKGATSPVLIGVEPDRAACVLQSVRMGKVTTVPGPQDSIMAGLNCGTPSLVAWPFVGRGFDVYMAITDERAREGMRLLANDGVVAGETGAAGMGGLLETLGEGSPLRETVELNSGSGVLLLCTEGATDPESYERIVGRRQ